MMMALICEQNRKEREEADAEKDIGGAPEIFSFMMSLEEIEEEERNPSMVVVKKTAVLKKMKVSELKELHNLLGVSLPPDKKKPSLFANLHIVTGLHSRAEKFTRCWVFCLPMLFLPNHN